LSLILDSDKIVSDGAYREEIRHRFFADTFFTAECMGFTKFNRRLHQPAVDLQIPWNPNIAIEDTDPIKFRMHLDPRKTFKTTLGLVNTAQALAAHAAKLTLLYETATQPLAASMMNVTVRHFDRGWLKQLFPEVTFSKRTKEDCYDCSLRTEPSIDPTVGYTSPQSAQAGWHPYLMNVDDAVDAVNSGIGASDESRNKLKTTHQTNKNLLRAGGYMTIRGTRYHPFDMYGSELETMNRDKWKVLIRGSLTLKNGERLVAGEFPDEDAMVLNFGELREMDYSSLRDLFNSDYETFMCQQMNDPMGGAIVTFTDLMWLAAQMDADRLPPIGETMLYWRPAYGGKPYMATHDEGAMVRAVNGKLFVLDCYRGIYSPTGRASKIVAEMKSHEADAVVIEGAPGTQFIGADLRNEGLRRNRSVRVQWVEFEEDDHVRQGRMKKTEPLMKAGTLLFSTKMKHGVDCRKQFLNFGLLQENGIVDCISRATDLVPMSLWRANMTEEELEYQRKRREDAQWNQIFGQMGMNAVDENERRKAMATMMALESVKTIAGGVSPLPGGLDG
jgi:hypothetical protein